MVAEGLGTRLGPAGPAAAGPILGQLTPAKMPYELWWVVQVVALKVATLEGTSETAVIHKISVGAGGKHTLSPEESLRRSVSFGKLYTLTIDRA